MCLFLSLIFLSHTVIPVAQKLLLTLSSETPPDGLEGTIWDIWDSIQVGYICNASAQPAVPSLCVFYLTVFVCIQLQ